jgi:Sulfite exporter TauE/SafE.
MLSNNFQTTLTILLPASILVNCFQLRNNFKNIDQHFYKNLILFSLPGIFITLYVFQSREVNPNFIIGIILIIISFQSMIRTIQTRLKIILNYEKFYLVVIGILHSLTNLGGSLLSGAVLSKDLPKNSKKATIAISYCSMACIQVLTLTTQTKFNTFLNKNYFLYWVFAPIIFFLVEKYLYYSVDEKLYKKISNFFLFLMGLIILIKT